MTTLYRSRSGSANGLRDLSSDKINRRSSATQRRKGNHSQNNNSGLQSVSHQSVPVTNTQTRSFENLLCKESLHKIQTESDPDCRATTAECDQLLQIEEQYSRNVSEFMFDCDVLNLRRRELLHRRWVDHVYDPIHSEVMSQLSSDEFQRVLLHKRLLFNNYLEQCNRKTYISVDNTVQPISNDLPLRLTARVGPLNDPLLQQERTLIAEDRIALRCLTGKRLPSAEIQRLRLPRLPLVPAGRHGITWHQYQIMHINDMESPAHQMSRRKMHPNKNHSQVAWDCYDRPCEPAAVAAQRHHTAADDTAVEQTTVDAAAAETCPPCTEAPPQSDAVECETAAGETAVEQHQQQQQQQHAVHVL